MSMEIAIKTLEQQHQKEMDSLRSKLSYQVWEAQQEQKEVVKKVFGILQKADPFWSGLFASCPDEKVVYKHLADKMLELKRARKLMRKMVDTYQKAFEEIEEEELPKVFKETLNSKLEVEDENQRLKDEKIEIIETHKGQLDDIKRNLEPTKTKAEQVIEQIEDIQYQSDEELEKVKKEQLEQEKK